MKRTSPSNFNIILESFIPTEWGCCNSLPKSLIITILAICHADPHPPLTGIYPFIVPCFIMLHRCCAFYKLKMRPPTSKKVTDHFIAMLGLLWNL